jgi:hypothetical protein
VRGKAITVLGRYANRRGRKKCVAKLRIALALAAGLGAARGRTMPAMKGRKSTRWEVSQQSAPPAVRPRPTRWRSYDLKGPLPRSTTRALEVAIYSLPAHTSWPALDEEAWWRDVLADR